MKKTTNRIQENYTKAKSLVNALEVEIARIEREYIQENVIINPDGTIPERIYMIEDEPVFNTANEATASEIEALNTYPARKALRQAENELIDFGLALAPAKERKVLTDRCFGLNGHYAHVDIREKCIDLALKLDVSTIPKGMTAR